MDIILAVLVVVAIFALVGLAYFIIMGDDAGKE